MQTPHIDYSNVVFHILKYLKKALGQGLLYEVKGSNQISGYCVVNWVWSPRNVSLDIVFSLEGMLFLEKARNIM